MSGIVLIVVVFVLLAAGLGVVAYFTYQRKLRRAKAIERGLKMVPILIHLPPPSSDTEVGNRDVREVMREKTSQAEVLYNLIAGTATEGLRSTFYGQRHIALELIAVNKVVHFFVGVPVALVSVVEKAVQTAYPGARLEEVEDHNIFNQEGRLAATLGGEMVLRAESAYPIATYAKLEHDPMEAILTAISTLEKQDGVAVQVMLRPANAKWTRRSIAIAEAKRKGRKGGLSFSAMDLARAAVKSPTARREEEQARLGASQAVSNLELGEVEAIEEKTKHPGFEVLIRVIVSTGSVARSQQLLRDIATAFALFETPGMNGFKFLPAIDVQGLVTAFIFRFFPPELRSNVLNSVELATLFHLPDSQFTPSTSVERQQSKQVDGPVQLPTSGLLFGHNEFRGVKKEIRLSSEDRRRHTYILGQTGTGKSTMLENLAVQDMLAGNGFAFIDPHGDSAEKLLSMVPKERAEDVIYFNPADTQYPLGLNLFEFSDPSQKDFIVQETINMLYKLYDPGHTGIIGPRYEHWYRNAALTLMSDPNGATFIEIPKVFTDTEYLKQKFKYLRDPTVIDFWTKEMGQTSDYHKSEMLGWFVSKFGAFQNNEMMRNIIGQTKSAFNLREVMDRKRILIVNLSKGRVGELNSQLLGMIFVIKFQAAAMSRADVAEEQRSDFALYVDEFQNFSTDSFASILSEARKYRLNLIVANQFMGQLTDEIRNAVFGNIGTIVAHRMGPEDAEFMVKQFAPVFDVGDLVNLPNFTAVMRLMIGGLPSQPFTIRDTPPLVGANAELGMAVKQLSAAKYGRSRAVVEAEIFDRLSGRRVPAGGVMDPAETAGETGVMAAAGVAVGTAAGVAVGTTAGATGGADPGVGAAPVVGEGAGLTAGGALAPPPTVTPPAAGGAVGVPVPGAAMSMARPSMAAGVASTDVGAVAGATAAALGTMAAGSAPVGAPLGPSLESVAPPAPGAVAVDSLPGMAVAPPPIGAPPVDLQVPEVEAAPGTMVAADGAVDALPASLAPVVDEAALGSAPARGALADDPGMLSLRDITGGRLPERRAAIDPAEVPVLGTELPMGAGSGQGVGEALPDDPYANIEVLGEVRPPVIGGGGLGPEAGRPFVAAAAGFPVGGAPLPDDPYANIDVLGAPPPVARTEARAGSSAGETVVRAVPMQEAPMRAADLAREPAEPGVAVVPGPSVRVPESAMATPVPAVAASESVREPAPERLMRPARTEDWQGEGLEAPQAMPALRQPSAEELIHFVDPNAKEVLERPDIPERIQTDEGLKAATPVPVVVPQGPVVPEPVVTGGPSVSALAVPLEKMAASPPPIGAPPVAAPLVVEAPVAQPAPSVTRALMEPEEAQIAKAAAAAPVPALNASLVAALQEAPTLPQAEPVVPEVPASPKQAGVPSQAGAVEPVGGTLAEKQVGTVAGLASAPAAAGVVAGTAAVKATAPAAVTAVAQIPVEPARAEAGREVRATALRGVAPSRSATPPAEGSAAVGTRSAGLTPTDGQAAAGAPLIRPIRTERPFVATAQPHVTPAEQVERAEHEIDDLLSVSLIHPESSAGSHRRLHDPVEVPQPDETGVDLELNAQRGESVAPAGTPAHMMAQHHGLKVIQPLEPIVPPREQFAKELAAMQQLAPQRPVKAAGGALAGGSGAAVTAGEAMVPAGPAAAGLRPEGQPKATPAPGAPVHSPLQVGLARPSGSSVRVAGPARLPAGTADTARVETAHHPAAAPSGGSPVPPAGPAPAATVDELPPAESLAASDVAKARMEHEQLVMQPAAAGVTASRPEAADGATGAAVPQSGASQQAADERTGKRKRKRLGRERPAERIESEAEAEHNKPTEVEQEAGSLTGTLILPTGEKPRSEPAQPKTQRPQRLAPGEVYVDEHGNVMIGE